MGALLLVLLLALILGGVGFAAHIVWVLAVIALVVFAVLLLTRGRGTRGL